MSPLGGAGTTVGLTLGLYALGDPSLAIATGIAAAVSHALVRILKRAVARPRPCDAHGRPLALVEPPDPFSFPSGHAAAATAVAASVALQYPRVGLLVLPLALLVAWSRVALRVHHVSDVLAGMALGLGGALAALLLR